MIGNLDDEIQNQIYQSFSNNNNDNPDNINNSSVKKENNIEFTFKKNISDSNNKDKETDKEIGHNIYSKNDENIKQSGHFYNENESKYKKVIDNEKEKHNNIIKPLFKYIIRKKQEMQNLNMNKMNDTLNMLNTQKTNINKINYFKKNLKLNNIVNNSNSGSNITTLNNNTLFNVMMTKSPLNSFLEISHESYTENNEISNTNANENKENFNNQNYNFVKYKNNFNMNKKIFNSVIWNKSIEKRNTNYERTRNKPKIKKDKNDKYEKYEKNISFEILKNEYKELKQKIIENKKKFKLNKTNKDCTRNINKNNDKKVNSNKDLIVNLKINKTKTKFNTINLLKKNIEQNNIKILKKTKFSPTNGNFHLLNANNHLNSHRRLKTISPIFI